jgi:hypothetical protein
MNPVLDEKDVCWRGDRVRLVFIIVKFNDLTILCEVLGSGFLGFETV